MASAVRIATSAGSPDLIRFRRALVGAKSAITGVPVSCSYRKESSRMAFMRARVERTLIPARVDVACELPIIEPLVPHLVHTATCVRSEQLLAREYKGARAGRPPLAINGEGRSRSVFRAVMSSDD